MYAENGLTPGVPIGDPAPIYDRRWCIAITVEHDESADEDRILYAWLDDVDSANGGPPAASGVFFNGGSDYEIQSAKVTTAYFYSAYGPSQSRIEVAVAFMFRMKPHLPGVPWGIACVYGLWMQSGFPDDPMGLSLEPEFHACDGHPGNWAPDIAYNYRNADFHLVWTTWSEFDPDPPRLAYQRYRRYKGTWSQRYLLFDPNNPMQQWIPRLAVGDAGLGQAPHDYVVAAVYTQSQTIGGFPGPYHVGCAYWSPYDTDPTDPIENAVFFGLPYDISHAAGLPRIAITPDSCLRKYGSISFTQATEDGYQAIEVNNIRNASTYFEYFWPIEHANNTYGIFPAVACHIVDGGDPMASVSYYEQLDPGQWQVTYGRFDPTLLAPDPHFRTMTGPGASVSGEFGPADYGDYLQIETFQGSEIVAIDAGGWDQAFWVGWCDFIDSAATSVYAAFGDSS